MNSYTVKQKIITAIAFIVILIVVPFLISYEHEQIAFSLTLLAYFFLFLFIIDLKFERIVKGVVVILFGIFFGVFYVDYFSNIISADSLDDGLKKQLKILSDLAIFSCAGAGGSLIATHADKTSSDREDSVISKTVIDKTQDIRILTEHILMLHRKVNAMFYVGIILAIVMLVFF